MATVEPITLLDQLEQQLMKVPRDRRLDAEMILNVLEQPAAFASRDVVAWATRAAQAARTHGLTAERARALYLRGIGHMALWRELVAAGGPGAGMSHCEQAAADLEEAFDLFLEAEQQHHEKQRQRAEQLRRRDKAKERVKDVAEDAVAGLLRRGSIQAALGRARLFEYSNAPGDAFRWIRRAIARCNEMPGDPLAAAAHETLGDLLRNTGDMDAAVEEFRHVLTIRRQLGDTEGTAAALARLAGTHHERQEFDAALQYNAESLKLYERAAHGHDMMGDKAKARVCRYYMLSVQRNEAEMWLARREREPVKALELSVRILEGYDTLSEEVCDQAGLATIADIHENIVHTHLVIGRAHEALGQLEPALDEYAKAYRLAKRHGRPHLLLPILLHVGSIHRTRGEIADALGAFRNALEIAGLAGNIRLQAQFHQQLSETLQCDRQLEQALEHYKRFAELQEAIIGGERQTAIAIQRIRFDTGQRELETQALRERNALLEDRLAYFVVTVGFHDESDKPVPADRATKKGERATVSSSSKSSTGGGEPESANKWIYFQNLLDDRYPGFLTTLRERAPALTERQVQVCALMRLGINSNDITKALRVNLRTLQTHRGNIRKRLPGTRCGNLVTWMLNITSPDLAGLMPPPVHFAG